MRSCLVPALVVVSFIVHPAYATGASEPAEMLRRFARAAMGDDASLAARAWVPGPARDAFLKQLDRARMTRCRRVIDVAVGNLTTTGEAADGDVAVDLAEWNDAGLQRRERRTYRATLAREGESWRIANWIPLEQWVAARIVDARSVEERRAMVRQYPLARLPMALSAAAINLINTDRLLEAEQALETGAAMADASGDPAAMAYVLSGRCVLLRTMRKLDEAYAVGARAVALANESGDPDAVANALLRFGRSANYVSETKPEAAFERVLSMADLVEDPSIVALAATQLAAIHDGRNEPRTGLRYALEAQRFAAMSDSTSALISVELNLGGSCLQIGDAAMASFHYRNAVELATNAGFGTVAGSAAFMYAQIAGDESRYALAQALLTRRPSTITPDDEAFMLMLLAEQCVMQHEDGVAEDYIQRAHRKSPFLAWGIWRQLAWLRYRQHRDAEAVAIVDAASQHSQGAVEAHELDAVLVKALALSRLGMTEEAIVLLKQQLNWYEQAQAAVPFSPRQFRAFARWYQDLHLTLVRLLVESKRVKEALWYADAGKAQALRMFSGRASGAVLTPSVAAARSSEETRLTRINRSLRDVDPHDANGIARLQDELAKARTQLQRLELLIPPGPGIRHESVGDYSAFVTAPGIVGLQYVVRADGVYLFTYRGASAESLSVRHYDIPIPLETLNAWVAELSRAIENRDSRWRLPAKRLYDVLVAPAARELRGARTVVIVPHGILWGVPFHALVGPSGQPLIEKAAVEYRLATRSGAPKQRPRRIRSDGLILAFANPVPEGKPARARSFSVADSVRALPDAEAEVRSVGALYAGSKRRIYIGAEAQESRFKLEAPRARILHVAMHGFAESEWPMYSGLLFARPPAGDPEDGILEAREIAAMKLHAEVAVLAACETGRGEYDWAEGVVGLPWAFLVAGTPTVVVSQWKVSSRSTSQLMADFHTRLRQPGVTAAEALRGAQRALRARARYAHPIYWAPFVTITGQ